MITKAEDALKQALRQCQADSAKPGDYAQWITLSAEDGTTLLAELERLRQRLRASEALLTKAMDGKSYAESRRLISALIAKGMARR